MRLAKALIRLRACAGWSEALLVAQTTLLEIPCQGSIIKSSKSWDHLLNILEKRIFQKKWTYNIRKQQIRLYWVCSWEIMESVTILMPSSTSLSGILLSARTHYSRRDKNMEKISKLYRCMGRCFTNSTQMSNITHKTLIWKYFSKVWFISTPSPSCRCGVESTTHFFFTSLHYSLDRLRYLLAYLGNLTINYLLFGCAIQTEEFNESFLKLQFLVKSWWFV